MTMPAVVTQRGASVTTVTQAKDKPQDPRAMSVADWMAYFTLEQLAELHAMAMEEARFPYGPPERQQ